MFSMPKMEMAEFEVEAIMAASEEEVTTTTTKTTKTQGNWGEEEEL